MCDSVARGSGLSRLSRMSSFINSLAAPLSCCCGKCQSGKGNSQVGTTARTGGRFQKVLHNHPRKLIATKKADPDPQSSSIHEFTNRGTSLWPKILRHCKP